MYQNLKKSDIAGQTSLQIVSNAAPAGNILVILCIYFNIAIAIHISILDLSAIAEIPFLVVG